MFSGYRHSFEVYDLLGSLDDRVQLHWVLGAKEPYPCVFPFKCLGNKVHISNNSARAHILEVFSQFLYTASVFRPDKDIRFSFLGNDMFAEIII